MLDNKLATPLSSTLTAGIAGSGLALAQSAIALLSRTHDGLHTHYVSKPAAPTQVVGDALRAVMVTTTDDGGRTESLAWKTRNLAQEVFGVELLASAFGMAVANTYGHWVSQQDPPSGNFEAFARGFGGVFATVGVLFLSGLSLAQRRGHTDDQFMSGTQGALSQLSPNAHPGSVQKLLGLRPGSFGSDVAGAIEGGFQVYRTLCTLPANIVLDFANAITTPLHPPMPSMEPVSDEGRPAEDAAKDAGEVNDDTVHAREEDEDTITIAMDPDR